MKTFLDADSSRSAAAAAAADHLALQVRRFPHGVPYYARVRCRPFLLYTRLCYFLLLLQHQHQHHHHRRRRRRRCHYDGSSVSCGILLSH